MYWRGLFRELAFVAVVVICFYKYWKLLGGYFDHIYEPDTDFKLIDVYINIFTLTDIKSIPNPIVDRDLAYFDAGPMLYALFAIILRGFAMPLLNSAFGVHTHESLLIFTVYFTNLLIYSVGAGFFFRISHILTKSIAFSFFLALLFAFSPQIIAIHPIRLDYLVSPFIVILTYLCVLVLQGRQSTAVVMPLGVISVLVMATKVTGIVYLFLPFLAFAMHWRNNSLSTRSLRIFGFFFLITFLFVMARYLYFGNLVAAFVEGVRIQKQWARTFNYTPYLFYNINNFISYGNMFLSVAFISIAVLVYSSIKLKDSTSILILSGLLLYSLLLLPSPKLGRWGHTISFFYFLSISASFGIIHSLVKTRTIGLVREGYVTALFMALLIEPAQAFANMYTLVFNESQHQMEAIRLTKTAPIDWFKSKASGRREDVCIFRDSEWAVPPLPAADFQLIYGPFNLPYREPVAMSNFRPPSLEEVSRQCKFIMIDKFHRDNYLPLFTRFGSPDLERDWNVFFDSSLLHNYEHIPFYTDYLEWKKWNIDVYFRKPL